MPTSVAPAAQARSQLVLVVDLDQRVEAAVAALVEQAVAAVVAGERGGDQQHGGGAGLGRLPDW